jgi:dTDP-4-dehydrorhamnose reductase
MLVTGASGLLGANFAVAASRDFQVTACYGRHAFIWEGIDGFSVDLRKPEETAALLVWTRPAIIAHFAALTNVDQCEEEPEVAEEVNVGITERLAKWAAANNTRFLLMSTDSVFDGIRGGYTESDQTNPLNRYAATKLAAEKAVQAAGVDHLIVRANIYGWNAQAKSSLAEWILARLEKDQQVPGFTDVVFAPLLVNTLTDIMIAMLNRGAGGLYHVASSTALSKYDFALAVAGVFGFPTESIVPTVVGTSLKAPRPRNTALDASRLHRELGAALPAVVGDVQRFRLLRDTGYVDRLKAACSYPP